MVKRLMKFIYRNREEQTAFFFINKISTPALGMVLTPNIYATYPQRFTGWSLLVAAKF